MNILPPELLVPTLSRVGLLSLPLPEGLQEIVIAVHRNHAFETVASVLNVFLAQSGLSARFCYSSYDDSLSFTDSLLQADVHILWLDFVRYTGSDLSTWLAERIQTLRDKTSAPLIICCYGANLGLPDEPGCLFCDMADILRPLGEKAQDLRLAPFSGTRLSSQACLECARWLGLRYLPAFFRTCLKALVLDCDNTLYEGVLAEDGIDGVKPHLAVQKRLSELARQGIMLTLASKNEHADVYALFEKRSDFILHWHDFAATAVNWQPKAENIRLLAQKLNIGLDALLFIDDNAGELAQVGFALPEVHLLAAVSPAGTLRGLEFQPLLWKNRALVEDSLRSADVRANQQRQCMRQALKPEEYRKQLEISLDFAVNPLARLDRVTELLNKTNQFVFSLLRPKREDVQSFMTSSDKVCVTCNLRDKLSDSGMIAILLGQKSQEEDLQVKELAVSCRALGRGIETGMVFALLAQACHLLCCTHVQLSWSKGPRNQPALLWLKENWPGTLENQTAEAYSTQLIGHLKDITVTFQSNPCQAEKMV